MRDSHGYPVHLDWPHSNAQFIAEYVGAVIQPPPVGERLKPDTVCAYKWNRRTPLVFTYKRNTYRVMRLNRENALWPS